MTHNGSEICSHLWAQGAFAFVCIINSCSIRTVFSRSSVSFESSDWLEGTWKQLEGWTGCHHGHKWTSLILWPFLCCLPFFLLLLKQCVLIRAEWQGDISARSTDMHTLAHTLKHPLALVEDSLHLSAFKNLLSLFSQGPALLSLSSSSPLLTLSLLDLCSMCFIHFQFFYTARHLCSLYILFCSVIFDCLPIIVLLSSRGTSLPPCLVEWNFKKVLRFIVMSVEAVLGIRIRFYCLTLAVFCRRLSPPAVWMSTCWWLFLL